MRLIFATNNIHKLKEIKEILGEKYKDFIFSIKDFDIVCEPEETGKNYEENADIKSKALYDVLRINGKLEKGDIIVADDTGLSIDYLDGAPGIRSARFMGKDTNQADKNTKIIELMKDVPNEDRTAYFITVLSVILVGDEIGDICKPLHFKGRIDGYIARFIEKTGGFGYDPIFAVGDPKDIDNGKVKTFSSLGSEGKNAISHRSIALSNFVDFLEINHNI